MRRFKDFLTESQSGNTFQFSVYGYLNVKMSDETFMKIRDVVQPDLECGYIDINSQQDNITFTYYRLPYNVCGRDNLNEILVRTIDEFTSEMHNFLSSNGDEFEFTDGSSILTSLGMPTTPMDWEHGLIYIEKGDSLKGIEKLVSLCDSVSFDDCHNLETGLLNLMKIPKKVTVYFDGIPTKAPWIKIVTKHLMGERNLLDCKEELMNAGYKEYAKL